MARRRLEPDQPAWGVRSGFLRARNNGFLALQATGVFDPAFNPAIAGSAPLSVIPGSAAAFSRTPPSVASFRPARWLASPTCHDECRTRHRRAGPGDVPPNPGIYVADLIHNGGYTNYHALQLELRRQLRNGVMGRVITRSQTAARIRRARRRFASSRSSTTRAPSSTRDARHFTSPT